MEYSNKSCTFLTLLYVFFVFLLFGASSSKANKNAPTVISGVIGSYDLRSSKEQSINSSKNRHQKRLKQGNKGSSTVVISGVAGNYNLRSLEKKSINSSTPSHRKGLQQGNKGTHKPSQKKRRQKLLVQQSGLLSVEKQKQSAASPLYEELVTLINKCIQENDDNSMETEPSAGPGQDPEFVAIVEQLKKYVKDRTHKNLNALMDTVNKLLPIEYLSQDLRTSDNDEPAARFVSDGTRSKKPHEGPGLKTHFDAPKILRLLQRLKPFATSGAASPIFKHILLFACIESGENAKCSLNEFNCYQYTLGRDGEECIPRRHECDGGGDCSNGYDEDDDYCEFEKRCRDGEYRCSIGGKPANCIPGIWKCDHMADCAEGDDEKNCTTPCGNNQHTCGVNGACLDNYKRCDGDRDCPDGEDEIGCEGCGARHHVCGSGGCVPKDWMCDGDGDCPDGSDEKNCTTTPPSTKVASSNPDQSIYQTPDTLSNTSLQGLGRTRSSTRGLGRTRSSTSPQGLVGSTRSSTSPQGLVGSTRSSTSTPCGYNQHTCGVNGACLDNYKRCDGDRDCPNGEDEIDCVGCGARHHACGSGGCVPKDWKCDGDRDCPDGSDEKNCTITPPSTKVASSNPDQSIYQTPDTLSNTSLQGLGRTRSSTRGLGRTRSSTRGLGRTRSPTLPNDTGWWGLVSGTGSPTLPNNTSQWGLVSGTRSPTLPNNTSQWGLVNVTGSPTLPNNTSQWGLVNVTGSPRLSNNTSLRGLVNGTEATLFGYMSPGNTTIGFSNSPSAYQSNTSGNNNAIYAATAAAGGGGLIGVAAGVVFFYKWYNNARTRFRNYPRPKSWNSCSSIATSAFNVIKSAGLGALDVFRCTPPEEDGLPLGEDVEEEDVEGSPLFMDSLI